MAQIGGGLQVGDALPPERELTQTYGVGRSSVREALRTLESRGLIQSRGNGAFVVADVRNPLKKSLGLLLAAEEADLHDLFEVRRMLEGEAAALASMQRTDEHLERLDQAIDDMEAGLDSHDDYIAADLDFHLTIAEATGNRVIVHLMHAIRDQLQHALGTVYHIPGSPQRSLEQHRGITDAVARRLHDEARERMREHIARVETEITTTAAPTRASI